MPSPRSIDDVGVRAVPRSVRRLGRRLLRSTRAELDWHRSRSGHADVALFHEFAPAPSGGGHQFLRALTHELDGRGLAVELNRISGRTPACLFNSFNFDSGRLRRFAERGARMVHRVDGPISAYRGFDDGTDARIGPSTRWTMRAPRSANRRKRLKSKLNELKRQAGVRPEMRLSSTARPRPSSSCVRARRN